MAQGTTAGVKLLSRRDQRYLEAARILSSRLTRTVPEQSRHEFVSDWAKVSTTRRDAGAGVGAGALQRDAYSTRGRGGKAPFSNRNLRWHPLVAAQVRAPHFRQMKVHVRGKGLVFSDQGGKEWTVETVHELFKPHCIDSEAWNQITAQVRNWDHEDWTANSCVIPAIEFCPPDDALETFATLGVTAAFICGAQAKDAHDEAVTYLREFSDGNLPSAGFPGRGKLTELCQCPVCRQSVKEPPAGMELPEREPSWNPPWLARKRAEGESGAIQLMHVRPLVERETRHTAQNVRYGHRWCNVAMADHDLVSAIDFFKTVSSRWR